MAVNRDSNGYTFVFAIILVTIVGAILAGLALFTKPFKDKNAIVKKKMDIVKALLPEDEAKKVNRKNASDIFEKYVDLKNAVVIDMNGDVQTDIEAFKVDIRKQNRDKELADADKRFPLYMATVDGETNYVIPVVGKGLWGPVWGNVCLKADKTTIKGATFAHKGETPGLGAEITQKFFINGWIGEKVADENGTFTKLEVVKDNSGNASINKKVDGITGGTITSKGVEEMVNRCVQPYMEYFKKNK